ncbi:MAG: hypothetical protein KKG47_11380 [Proteobacteria bacterium]|nr:hypothetical protein [Pseudomonadota bacterium]MBU1739416.1 hypothetical protein [Pseudomonadota bacterium]
MKSKQVSLVCNVLLLTWVLVANSGCSGSSSGGESSSGGSVTQPTAAASSSVVRVTTSGLLGTGLVVQNNGTEDLAINENTTAWFPTPVKEGSSCEVTIVSQPVSPAQTCDVVNGTMVVNGGSVVDVQVKCLTSITENFDSGELDSGYWHTSGAYDRRIVGGQLQFKLAEAGEFAFDHLPLRNSGCGEVAADVTITNTDFTGTGDKAFRTRLESCGYHTTTEGEGAGNRTGDVNAAIIWSGTEASFKVFRCLNDDCNTTDSVEYLTLGDSGGVPLGTAAFNSTATLMIDWDTIQANQFTFQLNNNPAVSFDPVAAGAPITAAAPARPEKYLGIQIALTNPEDQAEMTAIVDNVIDGLLSDNFDGVSYLDGSFWKKTSGRRQVENGKLVLETGQAYVNNIEADTRFNNSTDLHSNYDIIFRGAEVVEADLTLDPATFVVDSNPADSVEVSALLEMEFRPPGTSEKDLTDLFVIRAALKEGPSGAGTADILAVGCRDSSCGTKYAIANDSRSFAAAVVKGQPYHLKIEHLGNGVINVSLDQNETLSVDLSSIAQFATTEFSGVRLSVASQGTDAPGEEAFIRAFFENVSAGGP